MATDWAWHFKSVCDAVVSTGNDDYEAKRQIGFNNEYVRLVIVSIWTSWLWFVAGRLPSLETSLFYMAFYVGWGLLFGPYVIYALRKVVLPRKTLSVTRLATLY